MGTMMAEAPTKSPRSARPVEIDFLYIDLEVCDRCRGADANLEAALAEVSSVLNAAGRAPVVRRTLVESEEQARALGFVSSPTLRVNGRDVALELRESRCESCESYSCNGTVDCRVWVWQGQEHTVAPPAMIVDAILREIDGGLAPQAVPAATDVPEHLQRFFAGKAQLLSAQEAPAAAACCSPSEQTSCCEPEAKAWCCGDGAAGGCGCR